jgi:hypothetical protein
MATVACCGRQAQERRGYTGAKLRDEDRMHQGHSPEVLSPQPPIFRPAADRVDCVNPVEADGDGLGMSADLGKRVPP